MATRFLRTEPSMAFPHGRLLAARAGRVFVLAPDGWGPVGGGLPRGARTLSREETEDWCKREGCDLRLLDTVPTDL